MRFSSRTKFLFTLNYPRMKFHTRTRISFRMKTRMKSSRNDLYMNKILSWYHVNRCREICGDAVSESVLTRILPWGVPGPPLLRNRGPVRTLGGQSYAPINVNPVRGECGQGVGIWQISKFFDQIPQGGKRKVDQKCQKSPHPRGKI